MWLRVAKESRKDIHLSSSEVMEENPPWRMEMLTFGLNNLRHLFSKQVSWVFSPLRLKKMNSPELITVLLYLCSFLHLILDNESKVCYASS
jgi:hypothetical protein